jgi:hypothetical protein
MSLALKVPFPPMEALLVDKIPEGPEWEYEPKWDGFRCLAFRDRRKVQLQSKSGQPLTRYFPELVEALLKFEPWFAMAAPLSWARFNSAVWARSAALLKRSTSRRLRAAFRSARP